ncbi:MAG: sulfite exporter TauE/SafE family protein [Clostridia bacterium]|nr:sulfite exporter TauE/SafE family protein [Clostridia bacterium]
MKKKPKKIFKNTLMGILIGIVNGCFGAGGGMLAVPLLKRNGMEVKESHANAVAVILPITVISAIVYMWKGYVEFSDALPFIPSGVIGAGLGTLILKKISPFWLKRIFGGFMVYAGVRLILR